MAHYPDLGPCDYFGPTDARLVAVGWLQPGRPYSQGRVSLQFFEGLARLLENPWQPFAVAGRHPCEFCVFTGGPAEIRVGGTVVSLGMSNVYVPSEQGVFVAPSLVLHFIDAHGYAPPRSFQDAVAACPTMRSLDYLKSIRGHGVHRLTLPGGEAS